MEALNLSYKNGFRLFELDIRKTSDNIYVAVHDWESWADSTGYTGNIPPSKNEFMINKIHNKYTSLDIRAINTWFRNHPDAILVTDKINQPAKFANLFIDKNRLIMELFTWTAVKEAINVKVKYPMPTAKILKYVKGDKVAFLKKLGISKIASSYTFLNRNHNLILKMKEEGINIFAFHINRKKTHDENYIVCNYYNSFYGIYADKWNFNLPIRCEEGIINEK